MTWSRLVQLSLDHRVNNTNSSCELDDGGISDWLMFIYVYASRAGSAPKLLLCQEHYETSLCPAHNATLYSLLAGGSLSCW